MEDRTQKRRDQNYNARMDWWNEVKGPKGPISHGMGIIVFIIMVIGIGVIGTIITEIIGIFK